MAQKYANLWSEAAAGLTALAHTRAGVFRWGVVILLTAIWIGGGLFYWLSHGEDAAQATYLTLSAVGMWDAYFDADANAPGVQVDQTLQLVRFAALAAPAVGLLFAFSGQLGRSLARIFNLLAARHIVIAGDSPAALSLALDCRRSKDSVILIGQGLGEETSLGLRRKGVIVLSGEAMQVETLRTARANHASHVVAFEPDDTANLQIEAAVRRLVGDARRKPPIGVHVATRSAMLLREAREMRSSQMRKKKHAPPIDPKPFSLDELAARELVQREGQTLLGLAQHLGQDRLHIVFFGFDPSAETVAERVLMSLWSANLEAPRITVLAPQPAAAEAGFRARHREAFAHPSLWAADIVFTPFDWDTVAIDDDLLDSIEQTRGKPTAIVVSTGADPGNIHLAISLKRMCNRGHRWPVPIFMKETSESEFSRLYAGGDETSEVDAYLQAFGGHQIVATRKLVLDGWLDRGAAITHEHYNNNISNRDHMRLKDLQAAMRDWSDVIEVYRSANRAAADSALLKMWDAGYRPARAGETGETAPRIDESTVARLVQTEHKRWVAERLLTGWRPSGERNNDLMMHDKIAAWQTLVAEDLPHIRAQVSAAVDVARLLYPKGFVLRPAANAPAAVAATA